MPAGFFYLFTALAVAGAVALVSFRNPVSSAMAMVASFIGFAALFIGLNAYFVGIIQILVYAGAIMVLFLFIIMLLDLKPASQRTFKPAVLAAGVIIPLLFVVQLLGVLPKVPEGNGEELALEEAAVHFENNSEIKRNLEEGSLPDVNLVGLTMFGSKADNESIPSPGYNFPLQIIGVLLLVATIGVVALSMKQTNPEKEQGEGEGKGARSE